MSLHNPESYAHVVAGVESPAYELAYVMDRRGSPADWRVLAVVVWRGRGPAGPHRSSGAAGDGAPGRREVRYLWDHRAVRVGGRDYPIRDDGRSLLLLAEEGPGTQVSAVRVEVADVAPPPETRESAWSLLWRAVQARVLRRSVRPAPIQRWVAGITDVPSVRAFLAASQPTAPPNESS